MRELGDALAWLDGHQNLERMLATTRMVAPSLKRMTALVDILDNPERQYPVLHLTGTNGKTSAARLLTTLLAASGLSAGTFTSPHLERINERIMAAGRPISDVELAEVLDALADIEPLLEQVLGAGERLTWFEILTAAAFRWFGERPNDVGVIEVGLGGRWDATNVVRASVAVVTNIGLDHTEFLGGTREDVATEKSGIVKEGSTLILGETRPELAEIFRRAAAEAGADAVWARDEDFGVVSNRAAVGGRLLDLRTPGGSYDEVFLPLHGAHQGDNFACALAAAEAFFARPLAEDLVLQAASAAASPGRLEVVRRRPLVILDGVKNPDGARAARASLDEEFAVAGQRILVVGMLQGKDPAEMLTALGAEDASVVICCPPPSPRALDPETLAATGRALGLPGRVGVANSVEEAVEAALLSATPDDLILVTGSLYVVGAARTALRPR